MPSSDVLAALLRARAPRGALLLILCALGVGVGASPASAAVAPGSASATDTSFHVTQRDQAQVASVGFSAHRPDGVPYEIACRDVPAGSSGSTFVFRTPLPGGVSVTARSYAASSCRGEVTRSGPVQARTGGYYQIYRNWAPRFFRAS